MLRCQALKRTEKHGRANALEGVIPESAQSGTDDGGGLPDEREILFPDAGCGILEALELVIAAAKNRLFSTPLILSKRA